MVSNSPTPFFKSQEPLHVYYTFVYYTSVKKTFRSEDEDAQEENAEEPSTDLPALRPPARAFTALNTLYGSLPALSPADQSAAKSAYLHALFTLADDAIETISNAMKSAKPKDAANIALEVLARIGLDGKSTSGGTDSGSSASAITGAAVRAAVEGALRVGGVDAKRVFEVLSSRPPVTVKAEIMKEDGKTVEEEFVNAEEL